MARLPRWSLWLIASPIVGTVGLSVIGVGLYLLDAAVSYWSDDTIELVPFVAMIAAAWGLVGGAVAGTLCALSVFLLDRRDDRSGGTTDALIGVGFTTLFTLPFGLFQLSEGLGFGFGLWDAFVWVIFPVAATALIAAGVGRTIWRFTQIPPSAV